MFVTLKQEFFGNPPGKTIDVTPEHAELLTKEGAAEPCVNNPLEAVAARTLEQAMGRLSDGLSAAVDAALKQVSAAQAKAHKNAVPAIFGPQGDGDPGRCFGDWLRCVRLNDRERLEKVYGSVWRDGEATTKAAMNTQTGAQGGFAVPTEFYNRIMALAAESGIVRPRATVIPMGTRETDVPYLDVTTAPSAGDTAFLGGLVARWTEEGTTVNETEPALKQAKLTNYELSGYSKVSNALNQDFKGLEAFLFNLFAKAIAWYEDYAFLRGNGAGRPLGVQSWAGFIQVTRSGGSLFALADYAGVLARWLPNYDPKTSCWVCHPTVLAQLYKLAATNSMTLFIDNLHERPRHVLAGLPLEVTEKVPALGTAGDIFLADFSHYLIGDRGVLDIAFSEHAGFTTNQTFWRFVTRVGGMPWLRDKITLADATNTISPFVGLAA